VDRDRAVHRTGHPVDVVRAEAERRPRGEVRHQWIGGDPQRGLAEDAAHHGHRARGDVVVVPPGVVDGVPAQQPDVDVEITPEGHEVPAPGVEGHPVLPPVRVAGVLADVRQQAGAVEDATRRHGEASGCHRNLLTNEVNRFTVALQ